MEKFKLKKDDQVIVLTGKDKGKQGKIIQVIREERRVVVDGVNMMSKHIKPSRGNAGGIQQQPMPLHISNVALVDPQTGKATKVGYKITDGKKVRVAKKSGTVIESK